MRSARAFITVWWNPSAGAVKVIDPIVFAWSKTGGLPWLRAMGFCTRTIQGLPSGALCRLRRSTVILNSPYLIGRARTLSYSRAVALLADGLMQKPRSKLTWSPHTGDHGKCRESLFVSLLTVR